MEWKSFSLKEVNRPGGEPSVFDRQRAESVSVLALELAKAAQVSGPEVFERYHYRVFEVMHGDGRRLEANDLLSIGRDAGRGCGSAGWPRTTAKGSNVGRCSAHRRWCSTARPRCI
ncbi:MAG: hypothetical protein M3Q29_23055 [Chloroflexota bacterium]|nr:hypothetical protein [Chloroflexota bacterium]